MAREMLGVVLVMGLLLAMVPNTMQSRLTGANLDRRGSAYIGLILSTAHDEQLLLDSGMFVPETSVKKAGRVFKVGTFKGIIDYGNAASISPSVKLADVAVLSEASFISAWTWEQYEGRSMEALNDLPSLKIGDYNVPEAGDNKLASLQFQKISKYTPKGSNKKTFWYYIDPEWLKIASQLKDITLESCINGRLCTKDVPSVKFGVKGSSSDSYVQNEAYGKSLNKELGVSTVDRKSAATVSTAVANGVKHIVFRGASNKPGTSSDNEIKALTSKNLFKVVSEFVELLANELPMLKYKYI
uniref:Nucleoside phosphorylase domain-containing protein n=1 Tax=Chenopodium quinoa TaxID=63459 RepID=A0A803L2N3_CHEQI